MENEIVRDILLVDQGRFYAIAIPVSGLMPQEFGRVSTDS